VPLVHGFLQIQSDPRDPLARACYCRGAGPGGRHPCASSAGVGRGEMP